MKIEVRVPQLPESLADAMLVSWHKVAGDTVVRDDNLADLETDKVVLEIPAPQTGQLCEVKVAPGTTVTSGMLVAFIDVERGADLTPAEASAAPAGPAMAPAEPAMAPAAAAGPAEAPAEPAKVDARPATAIMPGTAAPAEPVPPAPLVRGLPASAVSGRRVPMGRLRSRIASRMLEAHNTGALLTTFNEVDLSALNGLRARYHERFERDHGVPLGLTSFFAKASADALKRFPIINASIDGNDIVYHQRYDIGVAVTTEHGLIVPVLRGVDAMSFADVERGVADFARRARSGTIKLEELIGGTFTMTDGDVSGSILSTPIVKPPQSGILGLHAVQERPVGVGGAIVLRPMMYLALTYDHRLVDGREAVEFLVTIKARIEEPARFLLDI